MEFRGTKGLKPGPASRLYRGSGDALAEAWETFAAALTPPARLLFSATASGDRQRPGDLRTASLDAFEGNLETETDEVGTVRQVSSGRRSTEGTELRFGRLLAPPVSPARTHFLDPATMPRFLTPEQLKGVCDTKFA